MVHERREQNYLTTVSLVILAFVSLAAALMYTQAVMIPFIMALFIVVIVSPVQDFQVKRLRFPRVIAAVVTLLLVLVMLALVSLLVTYTIQTFVATARPYSNVMADAANRALERLELTYKEKPEAGPQSAESTEPNVEAASIPQDEIWNDPNATDPNAVGLGDPNVIGFGDPNAIGFGDPNGIGLPDSPASAKKDLQVITGQLVTVVKRMVSDMQKHIPNIVTNAAGTVFGLIRSVFFVVIFVMFLVVGRDPYATHPEIYNNIVGKVRRYIGTKVVISFATGVLVWVVLARFRLPMASVFGILAFLLNFIPSIGSVISTLLPIPVAIAHFQVVGPEGAMVTSWGTVLLVVAIPGAIQMSMGNVIEPKLMGEGLNLHPVTILLALSFWGLLWGIVGMFLAAPITAAIRIALMQFDTFKPIGRLLAGDFKQARPIP